MTKKQNDRVMRSLTVARQRADRWVAAGRCAICGKPNTTRDGEDLCQRCHLTLKRELAALSCNL